MATFTAQILIGHDHEYHGGIIPSHGLYLSENSRPVWILKNLDLYEEGNDKQIIRWVPTLDNMLDDAMLLIGIHVIKDETVIKVAREFCNADNLNELELYEAFTPEDLKTLYELVRTTRIEYSIALTVFNESHIINQYKVLDYYECRANVFTLAHSNYNRR
ncbi:hypothetical protein ACR6HW_16670 [Fusibacter sp. JL298sf-3]